MITQITPTDTVETLRTMKREYRLTWADFAELLGMRDYSLFRILSGSVKPSRMFSQYVAQTAELWKQNPPPPTPERRGGYRGDRCAQRTEKQ